MAHRPGLLSRLVVARDVLAVELRMSALRLLTWLAEVEAWLRGSSNVEQHTPAAAAVAVA